MTDETFAARDLPTEAPTVGRILPVRARPIAAEQAFRRPEVALDAVTCGAWRAAGASLAGLGHLAVGTCRQDSFGLFVDDSGRLCVAVADGLGSRELSQLGAYLFVESVGQFARDSALPAAALLEQASARTQQVAENGYGLGPKELACTGLVAVLGPDGGEVARLGDVSAFRVTGAEFEEIFEPDGQYVNLVGACLPGPDAVSKVEVQALAAEGTVVFTTDGLASDIRTSEAVRAWLGACWLAPVAPFAMGDSLRFRRQGSHDDRTAVTVWRT